jgi:alpha-tubulin suppressor-like RCC1 family protein
VGAGESSEGFEKTPLKILEGVKEMAAGWGQSMALLKDGTVMTWGYSCTETPARVNFFLPTVCGIGCTHGLFWVITEEGVIYKWSRNDVPEELTGPEEGKKWALPQKRSELAWWEVFQWLFLAREQF